MNLAWQLARGKQRFGLPAPQTPFHAHQMRSTRFSRLTAGQNEH